MHLIVWQFLCRDGATQEFEAVYGPAGAWAQLFRQAPGFLGTELVRSTVDPARYLTLDRWETAAAFEAFKVHWADAYCILDAQCADLTEDEIRLGTYTAVDGERNQDELRM
jgi:quinol monooxygenase YgiN